MKTVPAWKGEVRDALLGKMQALGFTVENVAMDTWYVTPPDCDLGFNVRGIGAMAALAWGEMLRLGV